MAVGRAEPCLARPADCCPSLSLSVNAGPTDGGQEAASPQVPLFFQSRWPLATQTMALAAAKKLGSAATTAQRSKSRYQRRVHRRDDTGVALDDLEDGALFILILHTTSN